MQAVIVAPVSAKRRVSCFLFGPAAGVVFVLTVALGGRLRPDYTSYQAISELTLPASSYRFLSAGGLILFNLLLAGHGLELRSNFKYSLWLKLSGFLYLVAAAAGLVMIAFPMDPPLTDPTLSGTIHRTMATVAIISTVVVVICSAVGFRHIPQLKLMAAPSWWIGGAVGLTALGVWLSALDMSLMFGVYQKVSLGIFMLWLIATSLMMKRRLGG